MKCFIVPTNHWKFKQSEVAIFGRIANQIVRIEPIRRGVTCNMSASDQYIRWQNHQWHSVFFDRPWPCSPARDAAKNLQRRTTNNQLITMAIYVTRNDIFIFKSFVFWYEAKCVACKNPEDYIEDFWSDWLIPSSADMRLCPIHWERWLCWSLKPPILFFHSYIHSVWKYSTKHYTHSCNIQSLVIRSYIRHTKIQNKYA